MGKRGPESEPTPQSLRVFWIYNGGNDFPVTIKQELENGLGGKIEFFSSPSEALTTLEKKDREGLPPHLVVCPLYMIGMNGPALVKRARTNSSVRISSLCFCVLTNCVDDPLAEELRQLDVAVLQPGWVIPLPSRLRDVWEKNQKKANNH